MLHKYIECPDTYEFESTIASLETVKEHIHVTLSESFFFLDAGGQPSDRGTINSILVL
jgi:Ser-tRNA(Ala) deacylase AlaX